MAKMPRQPPVVEAGDVPMVVATDVLAIDLGADYVQITFGTAQMWGQKDIQERKISGRVFLTLSAWAALREAFEEKVVAVATVAEMVH